MEQGDTDKDADKQQKQQFVMGGGADFLGFILPLGCLYDGRYPGAHSRSHIAMLECWQDLALDNISRYGIG